MSIYQKYILPKLIDFVMRYKESVTERQRFIPLASGIVLEVGAGSGLNIPFYGLKVKKLYALDVSLESWKLAEKRAKNASFPIQFMQSSAENIPLENEAVDTVVTTWTLCTIPDPVKALKEIRRVLKPDGFFIFIEHGQSFNERMRIWQNRLNFLWKRVSGDCNLNRKIDDLITQAGFRFVEIQKDHNRVLGFLGCLYKGRAKKN